jgi:hypothetical protein
MAKAKYVVLGQPDQGLILDDGEARYGGEIVELDEREAAYRVQRGWLRPLPPPDLAPQEQVANTNDGGSPPEAPRGRRRGR